MLSPLKRPTWDKLHCWFCQKLLRIYFSFFLFFLLFLSCSWLWRQWTISTNIFNSSLGKYRIYPKIQYSWLWRQWIISQNKMNLKKKFYMLFFLVYPLLLFALFKWKKNKTLHNIFTFSSNNPQIEHRPGQKPGQKGVLGWVRSLDTTHTFFGPDRVQPYKLGWIQPTRLSYWLRPITEPSSRHA